MNTMPFGKYKNTPLAEVPVGYLRWLLETGELYDPLKSAVEAEVGCRSNVPERRVGRPPLREVAGGRRPASAPLSASVQAAAEQLLAASGGQLARALAALLVVIEAPEHRERSG